MKPFDHLDEMGVGEPGELGWIMAQMANLTRPPRSTTCQIGAVPAWTDPSRNALAMQDVLVCQQVGNETSEDTSHHE